jgi:hypothetical protein
MSTMLPEDPDELAPGASSTRNARSNLSDAPSSVKTPARCKIILEEDPAIPPTGLFISANGRPYLLMAGVEAQVPQEVISVLNDAVSSAPIIDPQTQKVTGYRSRLRFAYRRIE